MSFTVKSGSYDLEKTLKSGQVFRYRHMDNGIYRVMSLDKVCYVRQVDDSIFVKTGESKGLSEDDLYWRNYFKFSKDLNKITELTAGNVFLEKVVEYNRGLRLLRQDPWECLISFIISQQKTIPQIQANIDKLCTISGKYLGYGLFAFPQPEELLSISIAPAKLGYREKYVTSTAYEILSGNIKLDSLYPEACSYRECVQKLCSLRGVGVKVANCVALFAFGHTRAFPVDTHIDKMLKLPEMKDFKAIDYGDDAGLMQQYLFNYAISHNI